MLRRFSSHPQATATGNLFSFSIYRPTGAAGRPEIYDRDGAQEGAAVLAAKAAAGLTTAASSRWPTRSWPIRNSAAFAVSGGRRRRRHSTPDTWAGSRRDDGGNANGG